MSSQMNVHEDAEVARVVKELALEGYEGPGKAEFESREKFRWLREAGTALWLDTGDIGAASKVWSRETRCANDQQYACEPGRADRRDGRGDRRFGSEDTRGPARYNGA